MSTLGIFWICSVIVSYSVGLLMGIKLYNQKSKKPTKRGRRRR